MIVGFKDLDGWGFKIRINRMMGLQDHDFKDDGILGFWLSGFGLSGLQGLMILVQSFILNRITGLSGR